MICQFCAQGIHDDCANNWRYIAAANLHERRQPTDRPTWCDCQHRVNWDSVKIIHIRDSVRIPESFFQGIKERIASLPPGMLSLRGILEGDAKKDEHA